MNRRTLAPLLAASLLVSSAPLARAQGAYLETDLVSDVSGALRTDAQLANPWGLVVTPMGTVRVVNNVTATSEEFGPRGQRVGLTFDIPTRSGLGPTGIVRNGARGAFLLRKGNRSAPAVYIISSLDGTLAGWNPILDANHAIVVSTDTEASYTGLAVGSARGKPTLYAANFAGGHIEAYDSQFHETTLAGNFGDSNLEAGYSPFNVQNVGGHLFVAYAKRVGEDEQKGAGLGIVNEFDSEGRLVRRFVSHGALNAPWGVAAAPRGFGRFAGALLVGNFGDGVINAFDRRSGAFLGALTKSSGAPVAIEGLWGIGFRQGQDGENDDQGRGGNASFPGSNAFTTVGMGGGVRDGRGGMVGLTGDRGAEARLYFAAGIADEAHGLLGFIAPTGKSRRDDAPLAEVAVAEAPASLIALTRNPVRPFAGEAAVFHLGAAPDEAVELRIYDVAGRLVAVPANGVRGVAEVRWDGTGTTGARLQAGVYYYRAQAGDRTARGKLVLLP